MLKAVLFDWDGVVVDSSAAHKESWEILASQENLFLPDDHFERTFGRKNAVIIPEILSWTQDPIEIARLDFRKESLYRELLSETGLKALPGAKELIHSLTAAGIPKAIGTSTPRENIRLALKLLALEGQFEAEVTAEDVNRGKPDPEVFLKGAAALGVDPADCVVLEDAVYGIEAALAGGMKAVAVLGTSPAEKFKMAHLVVRDLTELSIEKLQALW